MNRFERSIEGLLFISRWLVAPFLAGLIIGLVGLLYKFALQIFKLATELQGAPYSDVIVGILSLIDISLTANLILIVIFSSYENFVRPVQAAEHPEWPEGLTRIGFAGLKQKLLGSIVAITAVHVLEWFMHLHDGADPLKLAWVVGIMLAFAITMVIVAAADRLSASANDH